MSCCRTGCTTIPLVSAKWWQVYDENGHAILDNYECSGCHDLVCDSSGCTIKYDLRPLPFDIDDSGKRYCRVHYTQLTGGTCDFDQDPRCTSSTKLQPLKNDDSGKVYCPKHLNTLKGISCAFDQDPRCTALTKLQSLENDDSGKVYCPKHFNTLKGILCAFDQNPRCTTRTNLQPLENDDSGKVYCPKHFNALKEISCAFEQNPRCTARTKLQPLKNDDSGKVYCPGHLNTMKGTSCAFDQNPRCTARTRLQSLENDDSGKVYCARHRDVLQLSTFSKDPRKLAKSLGLQQCHSDMESFTSTILDRFFVTDQFLDRRLDKISRLRISPAYVTPGVTRIAYSGAGGKHSAQLVHIGNAPMPTAADVPMLKRELDRLSDLYSRYKAENMKDNADDKQDEEPIDEADVEEYMRPLASALNADVETEEYDSEDESDDLELDLDALLGRISEANPITHDQVPSGEVLYARNKGEKQDLLADEALRHYIAHSTPTTGSGVHFGGVIYPVDVDVARTASAAVVSRISALHPHPLLIAIEHIKNHLVMIDYVPTWDQHQQQHPLAVPLPVLSTFNSFVLCRK